MSDDNRNGATGAPIEENPNDIAIALDLAGGADAWIEMTEAERAAAVREVAEIRQALEDPDAQDAEEIIKESVRKNRAFLSDDDLSERVADIFSSFSAKGARYTFNSVLRWAENLGGIAPYYERLVNKKPEYAELKNAHASVTLRPKEDAPEDVKALHELFKKAWAEAAQIWKEHEAEPAADPEEQERARQERKALQDSINAGLAALAIRPNTTVSNALLDAETFSEKYKDGRDLPSLFTGTNKEITTFAAVSVKDDANIKTSRPITEYGDAVQVAVNSLIYDREKAGLLRVFSIDQICRQLIATSDANGRKVTQKTREKVSNLIENVLSKIDVEIDATDELRARGKIGQEDPWNIKGPILPLERTDAGRIGGHNVKLYRFGRPVLLEYAEQNKQLIKTPIDALDIKEISATGEIMYDCPVKLSEERIAIRNYLWRRIENMRSDEARAREAWKRNEWRRKKDDTIEEKPVGSFRKLARVILFSSLIEEVQPGSNAQEKRAKDFAVLVLKNWKATGRIKSYSLRYRGKARKQMDAIEKITF